MGRISFSSYIKRYIKGLQDIHVTVNNVTLAKNDLLKGKTAIVTGASRGIGFFIAKQYVDSGAIVIAVAKTQKHLDHAKMKLGRNYIPLVFDLTEIDKINDFVLKAINIAPKNQIDILVNAAGIKNGQDASYWDFTSQDFDDAMAVNVKAPFFLCRAVIKHMLDNNIKGHIINISGIKGFIGESSPYSISKFGMVSLTKGLARKFAPQGVIVNGIAPGATNSGENLKRSNNDNYYLKDTPNMRMASPSEIGNMALFLASDMSQNIVGSIIVCDGGQMLQYQNNRY